MALTRLCPFCLEPLTGCVCQIEEAADISVTLDDGAAPQDAPRPPAEQVTDPDKPCPHEDFEVWAEVGRLTEGENGPAGAYSASIRINCARCREPFRWIGVQAGLRPDRPMVSVDETELRAPVRPASSDPDFGLGIPGFAVTWKAPGDPFADKAAQRGG